MQEKQSKLLYVALGLGLVFHGTAMFFTLEKTYDALIHLFFAEHYAGDWFNPWSQKWYTGFTVQGYPPLVHQAMGLLSYIGGLKFGLFTLTLVVVCLFIIGVYRFTLLMTSNKRSAGYAAIIAMLSSSFVETLHLFGQLPSLTGISVLMITLPEIYLWVLHGKTKNFISAVSLLMVTVTSHHVTTIFGMVFFIFPTIGMAVMDAARLRVSSYKEIKPRLFFTVLLTKSKLKRIILFGASALFSVVVCILPYWVNTKNNPITQVPIPHGSRDNFIEITSSGLVFFLIPWGVLLLFLPYFFYRYYHKRKLFFGLSLTMLFILGTGGTTPIPKMLLGDNAFNILTLDRFTLWASIMVLPLVGEMAKRLIEGDINRYIVKRYGIAIHRIMTGFLIFIFLGVTVFSLCLGRFRPSQPEPIDMLPLVNFLNQDMHYRWRFLPLGFGDQIAWLSAQTDALTVDGNYHSARRLPELTSRAIERLENSKFRGIEGLGSLQQFLTVPEKYHLKYVFSNDKFYDPLLYFSGWQRLRPLENGIVVWEKLSVPPLPSLLPAEKGNPILNLMWGIIPVLTVIIALLVAFWRLFLKRKNKNNPDVIPKALIVKNKYNKYSRNLFRFSFIWMAGMLLFVAGLSVSFAVSNAAQLSAENVIEAYYDAMDFKEFERAHSYMDPEAGKSMDQFMLEISVTNGLLGSYAKLDSMHIDFNYRSDTLAQAKVDGFWITPVKKIKRTFNHDLIKRGAKWFIIPEKADLNIPPERFLSQNETTFYGHGKRRISTNQTDHADILVKPIIEVLNAKMVCLDDEYIILGKMQNLANMPADVVIKSTLYTAADKPLATYQVKFEAKHRLMPMETTEFKLYFEDVAWVKQEDKIPDTFDPDQITMAELPDEPQTFDLHIASHVASSELYKNVAFQDVRIADNMVEGKLFNHGIKEATVPQIMISYYDNDKNLVDVQSYFIEEGIRSQRSGTFAIPLRFTPTEILIEDLSKCYVNGLPNKDLSPHYTREISTYNKTELLKVSDGFVRLSLNVYTEEQ